MNLECTKCGEQYYSASPVYAAEVMLCQNGCGATIEVKGENNGSSEESFHPGG